MLHISNAQSNISEYYASSSVAIEYTTKWNGNGYGNGNGKKLLVPSEVNSEQVFSNICPNCNHDRPGPDTNVTVGFWCTCKPEPDSDSESSEEPWTIESNSNDKPKPSNDSVVSGHLSTDRQTKNWDDLKFRTIKGKMN